MEAKRKRKESKEKKEKVRNAIEVALVANDACYVCFSSARVKKGQAMKAKSDE